MKKILCYVFISLLVSNRISGFRESFSRSSRRICSQLCDHKNHVSTTLSFPVDLCKKVLSVAAMLPIILSSNFVMAEDELAKYAQQGNKVGVDGQCFLRKCAVETSACANDPTCFKGLSCLARHVHNSYESLKHN